MVESVKLPDKEAVLKLLNEEKIEFKMMEHEALDTMQAGLDYFEKNKPEVENYVFAKNLFLKNKAGGYYLLTLHHKTASDFKTLTKVFKAKSGNIRQAEEDKLEAFLHVKQGSVTPLALLNLSEEQRKEVQFHLDKAIDTEYISVHPMKSTSTIFMKTQDLIKLLEKHGIKVNVTDFIVKESVGDAVDMLGAASIPSGKSKVVISNTQAAALLSTLLDVFSADQAQKGLSLLAGKENTPIASELVTLCDDPMCEKACCKAAFDAEGVATYRKNVIEKGVFKTLLYNLFFFLMEI